MYAIRSYYAPLDITAAWGHHLRYDGKGYPPQPDFVTLHPVTGILHICDVFEALTAVRPYKEAITPKEAYAIMMHDKGAFHPALLASFIHIVGLYPPGTFVTLSDNRTATVIRAGTELDRPAVRILRDKQNDDTSDQKSGYIVDLSHPEHQNIVITSYSIHYTKLYDRVMSENCATS